MHEILRRIRFLFHRAEYERELEEEMRHHLTLLEEDGRPGATAHRQFGNVTSLKEESRSMWTVAVFEQFAQDLRYALRSMAAAPLFTATAALSLALGIGANTAIYSFMDAILLRGLPVPHPEELAIAEWHVPRRSAVVKGINGRNRRYGKKCVGAQRGGSVTAERLHPAVTDGAFADIHADQLSAVAADPHVLRGARQE